MSYWRERSKPYQPGQKSAYKISRSKIELFMQCPRCFWLEVRHKISRPSSPPFNINKTIDELYKKEFDLHRVAGTPHPIMSLNGLKMKPFAHEKLDEWRDTFTGIHFNHKETNLHIFGAVDDIWVSEQGELAVVDYKATSKAKEVSIDSDWQISYKRQLEIYQWLLRKNKFTVSSTGYFVYTNARTDAAGFDDRLEFITKLIPYKGSSDWVDDTVSKIKTCMDGDIPPVGESIMGGDCEHCLYAKARTSLTLESLRSSKK